MRLRPFAFLVLVLATACSKKEPPHQKAPAEPLPLPRPGKVEDLGFICQDQSQIVFAPPYAKGNTPSPLGKLVKWGPDRKFESWGTSPALEPWTTDDPKKIQLIACVTATDIKKTRQCSYPGQGPTYHLDLHDATYSISIREAATGKVLAKKDISLKGNSACPATHTFRYQSEVLGPSMDETILELLLPLEPEQPPPPPPKLDDELLPACGGSPLPRQAAYDTTAGKTSPMYGFFQPESDGAFASAHSPEGRTNPDFMLFRFSKAFHAEEYESYQLVACITGVKKEKKLQSCPFGKGKVLEIREGDINVSVREAKTGKELGQKSFPARPSTCPLLHSFPEGQDLDTQIGEPGKAMEDWLKTFAQH